MTKAADPSLIDNLWYFDSVVTSKPPIKKAKSKSAKPATSGAAAAAADQEESLATASVSESGQQLPLSTGGDSYSYGEEVGAEDDGGGGSRAGVASICELVEKMEEGSGELSAKELDLWMQKLGLEYTADGAMIRRVPNTEFGSQQRLDFFEFVCLNRFIEDERRPAGCSSCSSHPITTTSSSVSTAGDDDAHLASLHHVFHLVDRDHNGLISPSELRAALAKLGLTNPHLV